MVLIGTFLKDYANGGHGSRVDSGKFQSFFFGPGSRVKNKKKNGSSVTFFRQ